MDINVYDKNFNRIFILDSYESLIWTDRYQDAGDFELSIPFDEKIFTYLQLDNYLEIEHSNKTMIIESINVKSDNTKGVVITITGRSLESILDRRIIWGKQQYPETEFVNNVVSGYPASFIIKSVLDKNIFNSPTDPVFRSISNLVNSVDYLQNIDPTKLKTIRSEYTGENILNVIKNLCLDNNFGFYIHRAHKDSNFFLFYLYKGSLKNVIFSEEYENIDDLESINTNINYKNSLLIKGEGFEIITDPETPTETITEDTSIFYDYPSTHSGLERRELYLDASDIKIREIDLKKLQIEAQKIIEELINEKTIKENNKLGFENVKSQLEIDNIELSKYIYFLNNNIQDLTSNKSSIVTQNTTYDPLPSLVNRNTYWSNLWTFYDIMGIYDLVSGAYPEGMHERIDKSNLYIDEPIDSTIPYFLDNLLSYYDAQYDLNIKKYGNNSYLGLNSSRVKKNSIDFSKLFFESMQINFSDQSDVENNFFVHLFGKTLNEIVENFKESEYYHFLGYLMAFREFYKYMCEQIVFSSTYCFRYKYISGTIGYRYEPENVRFRIKWIDEVNFSMESGYTDAVASYTTVNSYNIYGYSYSGDPTDIPEERDHWYIRRNDSEWKYNTSRIKPRLLAICKRIYLYLESIISNYGEMQSWIYHQSVNPSIYTSLDNACFEGFSQEVTFVPNGAYPNVYVNITDAKTNIKDNLIVDTSYSLFPKIYKSLSDEYNKYGLFKDLISTSVIERVINEMLLDKTEDETIKTSNENLIKDLTTQISELIVEINDLQKQIEALSDPNKLLLNEFYRLLNQRGLETLANRKIIDFSEFKLTETNSYVYNRDYTVGDEVIFKSNFSGEQIYIVTEQIISKNTDGLTMYPTLSKKE